MPGFAVQSSAAASEGFAKSAYIQGVGTTPTTLFTAVKKTRVTSVLANNTVGGILPVSLLLTRGGNTSYVVKNIRVMRRQHLVLSLIAQDDRVNPEKIGDIVHTELVLLPGDVLTATSPLDDSFDITITLFEGIS